MERSDADGGVMNTCAITEALNQHLKAQEYDDSLDALVEELQALPINELVALFVEHQGGVDFLKWQMADEIAEAVAVSRRIEAEDDEAEAAHDPYRLER